jgi:DNA polymerase (family 10)
MKQHDIAAQLNRMADLLELRGENLFRIRAYRRAAQNLESFTGDLEALADAGRLQELSGIGKDLADKITEFLRTGAIAAVEHVARTIAPGVLTLMEVPGVGPKTAKLLNERLGIASLEELEAAVQSHRLRTLPGFQEKKEQNILKGLGIVRKGQARMHLGIAFPLAQRLLASLKRVRGVTHVSTAGSLRRMKETIGDLDLLVASNDPKRVMKALITHPLCARVLASGETKSSILTTENVQVDLRVVAPASFGAALQYFTGSKEHNVRLREMASRKGLKINEYGVFRVATDRRLGGREESDIYDAVGLPYIPPELREDAGEIDAALKRQLPRLVSAADIRGDFHIHTTWSDGSDRLDEMAAAGAARGYQYLAICDHSQSLKVAHGMSIARLKQQMANIRAINRRTTRCRLLMGAEVDILSDGSMDYPDEILRQLDFVIGSIHSGFTQGAATMTRRIVRAMRNPYVTLIAHPTGRLMGQREGYAVDLEAIFSAATATGTALEINAYPKRLDLCDTMARRAKEVGVTLAVSTDSHSLDQLDQMVFGLGVARRAWLEPKQVLNTFSRDRLLAWIARKRAPSGRTRR